MPLPIVLCADDYGLSPAVGEGIRVLASNGRLSAISCLTTTPHWRPEAILLRSLPSSSVSVGLHLNFTLGSPLGPMPQLTPDGRFPPLPFLLVKAFAKRLDGGEIAEEIDRQLARFKECFGRLPDFIDGHEHVHQLPGIRQCLLRAVTAMANRPWVRCTALSTADLWSHRTALPGACIISALGHGFRRLCRTHGFRSNAGFAGIRRFASEPPYAVLFQRFLARATAQTLIMCHPGLLEETNAGSPRHPSTARAEECAFLASDAVPEILRAHRIILTPTPF